jgi:hypothetical protein
MSFLIQYVADVAPWIYAFCGLVAIYQLYKTWMVRAERRQAVFALEREKALNDLYNIFMTAMLLLVVMGGTYFISTTLATAVEPLVDETLAPTPQALIIPTPTNTPLPPTPTPTITPTSAPRPVVVQQPVVFNTPTPEPPPVPPASCPDGRSVIMAPGNGAAVQGMVSFIGTAQHEAFDYYKLEFAPGTEASQGYTWFAGGQEQVVNGYLGSLNSSALPNGTYTVQLVVVDQTGNYPPPCRVNIIIQN